MMAVPRPNHSKVFKRLRSTLIRELPDPETLLKNSELEGSFSPYELSRIQGPRMPTEKAERMVDVMECSSYEIFQNFLAALRVMKPELATRVESELRQAEESELRQAETDVAAPASSGTAKNANVCERAHPRLQPGGNGAGMGAPRQPQDMLQQKNIVEDAGIFGLNGGFPGPTHHVRHLSYTCREYLASRLNGNPPERNTFHGFCRAFGVENKLVQASCHSGNPTAYLLQSCSSRPEATLESLQQALTEVGMVDVFEDLLGMLNGDDGGGGGGGGPEDD